MAALETVLDSKTIKKVIIKRTPIKNTTQHYLIALFFISMFSHFILLGLSTFSSKFITYFSSNKSFLDMTFFLPHIPNKKLYHGIWTIFLYFYIVVVFSLTDSNITNAYQLILYIIIYMISIKFYLVNSNITH